MFTRLKERRYTYTNDYALIQLEKKQVLVVEL